MKLTIRDNIINGTVYGTNILYGGEGDDKQLIIPNYVEAIAEQAFGYTEVNPNIKELIFEPNGHVEIGYSAFAYSNLEKVDFSNSVEVIGAGAFEKCNLLKDVIFGDNLKTIESGAFLDNIKIEVIELPAGLQVIESQAFQGCKALERIIIPDSVNEIGNGAFNQCNSLKELHCNTENLDRFIDSFNAKNKPNMVVGFLDGTYTCISEAGEKTIAYIQKNQKKLIDIIIEKDNDIAMGALLALPIKEDKKYLSAVEKKAESKVRGVLLNMFNKKEQPQKADNLMLEDVPEKPKTLAEWKKVFKLTNIGEDEICVGTYKEYETSVTIPEMIGKRKVTKLENTFSGNTTITNVYLPESLKEIGDHSFDGCSSLLQITIPKKIKNIGFCAFRGCASLVEIVIPKGVNAIDSSAFEDCINITGIIIPDSVKRIGKYEGGILWGSVFEGCKKLADIELSAKLKYIPDSAFRGCRSLKKVVLPNEVKEIGGFAFNGCDSLEIITIPASVKTISVDYAFGGCSKLTIQTPSGTYAEQYAKEHGIQIVNIEE